MSRSLDAICEKLSRGRRLDQQDGETLFATDDVHTLGRLADERRRELHGDAAYYNVNRHINYTNACVLDCKFCGFRRRIGADDAYELTVEQVIEQAVQAADAGATEVHIVGGLHPRCGLDYCLATVRGIKRARPALHIKAFTAIEIAHVARLAGLSAERVLAELAGAGLGSLPGGGAEVFSERVRGETFRHKAGADEWFAIHAAAHRLGLPSNATMLYGHVETPAERVAHMLRLRAAQDAGGKFQAFVPLSFIPPASWSGPRPAGGGLDDLRTVAVARLLLDNVPHVKTFWVMVGAKLAQVALLWGADDIDGTVAFYDITHRDGASREQGLSVEQLHTLIRQGGLRPVERDSLYRPIER